MCLTRFRFKWTDVGKISNLMRCNSGKTRRKGYICNPLVANCIVMHRLSSPLRWNDIETTFRMHYSKMSEVF